MSTYQLSKETPPGSGTFVIQGAPVEASDPTGDPIQDALPGSILVVLATQEQTAGGSWSATKAGA